MVQPKQYQLENLSGDCTGQGDSNTVISLTGAGGLLPAGTNRITDVVDPINLQDAATKNYVDGVLATPPLSTVLSTGNITGIGNTIEMSLGSNIHGAIGVDVTINDNCIVNGKLTVTGLIDPTGLVLTPQAAAPTTNAIWVDNAAISSLIYDNSAGNQVFKAGEDTERYISVGDNFGSAGAIRLENDRYIYSNNKQITGYNTLINAVTIGDGYGAGNTIAIYSGDYITLVDPNSGSPQAKFTFDLTSGFLGFDSSNAVSAGILYGAIAGATHDFSIIGQSGTSGTGGGVNLIGGGSTVDRGGNVSLYSGNGAGGLDGYIILNYGVDEILRFSEDSIIFEKSVLTPTITQENASVLAGNTLTIQGQQANVPGGVSIIGGSGPQLTHGLGGDVTILSGSHIGSGDVDISTGSPLGASSAGDITLQGGDATNVRGGRIYLYGGDATVSGDGADITLTAGNGVDNGGNISLLAGTGTNADGGSITLRGGNGPTGQGAITLYCSTGGAGELNIVAASRIEISNSASVPTTDPVGGGYLYVEGGALKWRGSSGNITTIAPA